MLKLVDIGKKYKKNIIALDNINLDFPSTGLVFVEGDSGAGKSSLLNIIATLESPTTGEVLYNDKKLDKKSSVDYLKNEISIIFQDANLFDNLTVFDNLNIYNDTLEVDELLKTLDIDNLKNKKVKNLSGGEKRRVAIARAILKKPNILLCDEPEASLDEENRENIFNILKKLSKDMLIIVTSHDADIKNYADRIISMANGKVTNDEVKSKIKDKEKKEKKTYNVNKKFLNIVSKDILFSKKVSFTIIALMLAIFSSLVLLAGVMAKFNYVDILVDTMKHEDNHILFGTGEESKSYVMGPLTNDDGTGIFGEDYMKLNINVPKERWFNSMAISFINDAPEFLSFINYNDNFLIGDLIGNKPKEANEIVIYQVLAESIKYYGIETPDGEILKVNSIDELVGKTVMMEDLPVVISGIVKQDLSYYEDFRELGFDDLDDFSFADNIRYESFMGEIDTFKRLTMVDSSFFDYIEGHYERENKYSVYSSNYGENRISYEEDYSKARDYLSSVNSDTKMSLYGSLMSDGDFGELNLVGTMYANTTNILFLFYLIGQAIMLLSPILLVIMVYVIMMYFENVYKKNREKFAILSCLGLTNKDMNKVYFNALTMFFGSVLVLSIIVVTGTIIGLNAYLSNLVGFYLHPFSMNATYMLASILIIIATYIFSYLFLKFRVKKRNAIMYLKNN